MRLLFLLLVVTIHVPCFLRAQHILQLKNTRTGKVHERYAVGERIDFQVAGDPKEKWGTIDSIGQNLFYVNSIPYPLASVRKVRLSPAGCNWRGHGINLMIAGLGYPGIEAFNHLNNDEKVIISHSTIIVAAVLTAVGFIMYTTSDKRAYRLGHKYILKTI